MRARIPPIKTLIGRVYREFCSANRSVSTLRLEKMKTEADLQGAKQNMPKKTDLGGGYTLTKGDEDIKLPDVSLDSILRILQCLRIVTHLWTLCGAALVDSKEEFEPASNTPKRVRQFQRHGAPWATR